MFQVRSNELTQSWIGCSTGPLTRYQRCRPSLRTSTTPTCRSTARCLDTCGWLRPSRSTSSFTVTSPVPMASRRSRRLASATALNASVVVGVRAMSPLYSDMGICQARCSRPRWMNAERVGCVADLVAWEQRPERCVPVRVVTVEGRRVLWADVDVRRRVTGVAGREPDVDGHRELDGDGDVEVLRPQLGLTQRGEDVVTERPPLGECSRRVVVDLEAAVGLERREVLADGRVRRQLDADEGGARRARS